MTFKRQRVGSKSMSDLRVTEIYKSVQGESSWAGLPCSFVRLTGCPLRCRWCDTVYGFKGGQTMSYDEIIDKLQQLGTPLVELTGGEPLAQAGSKVLITKLIDRGFQVLIETSGSESLEGLHEKAHVIMDIKCPGSGMQDRNYWPNLNLIKASDEIKFVIANREDFDWAVRKVREENLEAKCQVLFSCVWGLLQPKDLVEWMLETNLRVRLNLQLHKFIWHPRAKGV
jgi:7-carboxy-7-deazaguanine synthase